MTSLSLNASTINASVVATAFKAAKATGGTETTTTFSIGTGATGWIELSPGITGTLTPAGSEPTSPSGHQFFLDDMTLDGQTLTGGIFTCKVTLSNNNPIAGVLVMRLWLYNGASYTQIGADIAASSQTINTGKTTYTWTGTIPTQTFVSGQHLSYDILLHITTGPTITSTSTNYWSNSGTTGIAGDGEVDTQGFIITGTPASRDYTIRGKIAGTSKRDFMIRALVATNAFHAFTIRASVAGPQAASWVSQYTFKSQVVQVFNASGTFLDTLYDAPLLAGFKEAVNTAPSQLTVSLPRSFNNYNPVGRPATIVLGNVVQYYLFGPGLPATGLLRYQGVIDSIVPEIAESGAETVTITITPQGAVIEDTGFVGPVNFGTAGSPGTYVDTVTQFNYFFINTLSRKAGIPVGSPKSGLPTPLPPIPPSQGVTGSFCAPLYLDPNNPASSGNKTQYSYSNQKISSIFDAILTMDPPNWFYRINPDLSVTHNAPPTTAQHLFLVGSHLVNPQVSQSVQLLKNDIIMNGAKAQTATSTTSTPTITSSSDKPGINFTNPGTGGESASLAHNPNITSTSSTPTTTTVLATTQITANSTGSDIATYNDRVMPFSDPRVTDSNTATTIAGGILTILDRVTTRAKVRLVDYRGDNQIGLGYDIESIKVGDTCQILDPTRENVSSGISSYALRAFGSPVTYPTGTQLSSVITGVVVITALTYNFYSIDLELDTPQPNFMHALNTLKRTVDRVTMT